MAGKSNRGECAGYFVETSSSVTLPLLCITPVWILLPAAPEWRWMLERSDTAWYGSARLFRQPRVGEWESVFAKVASALADSLRERDTRRAADSGTAARGF
jgi:hypothetical protein